MNEWKQKLPSVAAERVRRQVESQVAGSLLSTPATAALKAAELEPAGQVMGCVVMHLSWIGSNCGGYRATGNRNLITPVLVSGQQGGWRGYGSYVRARYRAYDTVLGRVLAETAALGADGVVGVDLKWHRLDSGAQELIALGTAVRNRREPVPADSRQEPVPADGRPFCTELSGEDVAKAVVSGWSPLSIVIGLSVAVKHEDATLRWQKSRLSGPGNVEVAGLTKIVHAARADARARLAERAGQLPGAVQIVVSRTELEVGTSACQDGPDHVAEATFVGTALAQHPGAHRSAATSNLSILPLGGITTRRRG